MDYSGPLFIFVPNPLVVYSLAITRTNGTIDDITDDVIGGKWSNMVFKEGVGSFEIELDNNKGTYENAYTGNEDFKVYMDYSDGSTLYFAGKIEKISPKWGDSGKRIKIVGSHVSYIALDRLVTLSKTDTITNIFNYLVDTYMTGYTHANVDTIDTSVTVTWSNKPLLDCFIDLCVLGNADGFINASKDCYFFVKGSKEVAEDAIVDDDNLFDSSGIGKDISDIKNTITVQGKNQEDLPIIYTSTDTSSTVGTKESFIDDTSISSDSEASDRAVAEKDNLKDAATKGDVTSLALAKTLPGYKIWICNPEQIPTAQHVVNIIEHTLKEGDLNASITVADSPRGVSSYFKERFKRELQKADILNPNSMKYSYNFDFDTNEGDNASMISGGKLVLPSGQSNSTWISNVRTLPEDISNYEIRVAGNDLNISTVQISSDNGNTFNSTKNLFSETGQVFNTVSGNNIIVKIILNSNSTYQNPYCDSFVVLMK